MLSRLRVRVATRPFMGRVARLSKTGKCLVLEDDNLILIAKYYKFYPVT